MIISRPFEPSSDLDLIDLAGRVYYPWNGGISEDNVYRSLDILIEKKERIEMDIFNALKPDTAIIHYAGKRKMYILSNSIEASNILKILKLAYPKMRESAHT
ncbi:MAG: hypothetical protein AAE977_00745 [Thermoplasmataceae archaeon]|jgi:hypothetical protein